MGKPRREAALLGAREITFAAIAATLSIMAIFLPVAFMTGTIGKFFFQFGVTVGVAVFLSLICALTLTPMLCAFFLNLHQRVPQRPRLVRRAAGPASSAAIVGLDRQRAVRLLALVVPEAGAVGLVAGVAGRHVRRCARRRGAGRVGRGGGPASALAEFALGVLLDAASATSLYWALDRYCPRAVCCCGRPTGCWRRLTRGYAWLLDWSLRHWGVVLAGGGA